MNRIVKGLRVGLRVFMMISRMWLHMIMNLELLILQY